MAAKKGGKQEAKKGKKAESESLPALSRWAYPCAVTCARAEDEAMDEGDDGAHHLTLALTRVDSPARTDGEAELKAFRKWMREFEMAGVRCWLAFFV